MEWNILFFFNSVLLGVGLAMDAFSVSLANGLHEPAMRKERMAQIAGVFALFQAFMPITGWLCVHTVVRYFKAFERFIPWIALVLLVYIGGKMIVEGNREKEETGKEQTEEMQAGVGGFALFIQGVATSIDALSVGFTISEYGFVMALVCALIIAAVTFIICMEGLRIGKKFGTVFSGRATVLGGVILIGIGVEIFIKGII